MSVTTESIEYGIVQPSERGAALAMLVSRETAAEQAGRIASIVTALRQGDVCNDTLVGAKRGEKLVAVAWGQVMRGKTVLLWPARLGPGEDESIGDQLQRFLDTQLAANGIRLAQAVVPDRMHTDAKRLARVAYTHAADLLYLASVLGQVRDPPADLEFEPYQEEERSRLSALVERTYIDTLDVPALDAVRDIEDVLDGYQQSGEFSPERWFFIRSKGQDVGCVLLNDHPHQQQWELVYMGIVPEARGNGWGSQATRFAQRLATDAGRQRLILAVDAANDPAISAYTRAGFFELLRRSVFLKIFGA